MLDSANREFVLLRPDHRLNEFEEAYCVGLSSFIRAIEYSRCSEADFRPILKFAFKNFGVPVKEVSARTRHSASAFSRWVNGDAIPIAAVRKVVIGSVLDCLREQYDRMTQSMDKESQL